MKNILIVEDDIDIHNVIKKALEKKEYNVLNSYSGKEALLLIRNRNVDLILLDLMLPDIGGEEIIKKVKDIPIIVISAKMSEEDRVENLLNGANDYIIKPFSLNELLARIKVQLRLNKEKNINKSLKYKEMYLDEELHYLYIGKKKIHLTKTENIIMKELLSRPEEIITKARLLDKISYDNLDFDENSLKVHISNIRKKIRNITENEYIESVWGIGFKLL